MKMACTQVNNAEAAPDAFIMYWSKARHIDVLLDLVISRCRDMIFVELFDLLQEDSFSENPLSSHPFSGSVEKNHHCLHDSFHTSWMEA